MPKSLNPGSRKNYGGIFNYLISAASSKIFHFPFRSIERRLLQVWMEASQRQCARVTWSFMRRLLKIRAGINLFNPSNWNTAPDDITGHSVRAGHSAVAHVFSGSFWPIYRRIVSVGYFFHFVGGWRIPSEFFGSLVKWSNSLFSIGIRELLTEECIEGLRWQRNR